MVEKVRGPDARFQDMLNQVYIEYKLSQGFTEIPNNQQKRYSKYFRTFSSKEIGTFERARFECS